MPAFDPYYEWLSIPPGEQPADLYRLLGLQRFEKNIRVIRSAADRQIAHVRAFSTGSQGRLARKVLKDLYLARLQLLHPQRRLAYDALLASAEVEQEEIAMHFVAARERRRSTRDTPRTLDGAGSEFLDEGELFAGYEIMQPVSIGPHGIVYKARRCVDGLIVSLRIMPATLLKSPEFLPRLRREFSILQSLNHPRVVAAYELGEMQGQPYLAFEYGGGTDLERYLIQSGPLSVAMATEILHQVTEGLSYLHQNGVFHRNLKPQSILLGVQGEVKIANFLKAVEDDSRSGGAYSDNNLTVMGQAIGSLQYLPPEQAVDSHGVDGRADLYALGCTLHTMLVGHPPYHGRDTLETLKAHRLGAIPSLRASRRDVPRWLDALYCRLMAKRPDERPSSAEDVEFVIWQQRNTRSQMIRTILTFTILASFIGLVAVVYLCYIRAV
jgi:serine/threonine protein kinase